MIGAKGEHGLGVQSGARLAHADSGCGFALHAQKRIRILRVDQRRRLAGRRGNILTGSAAFRLGTLRLDGLQLPDYLLHDEGNHFFIHSISLLTSERWSDRPRGM